MLTLPPSVRVYLSTEAVDLRRGHDGLAALVRRHWGEVLYEGHLFVFLGRRLDRCKILFFDRGGLVLYYKRLSESRFRYWPGEAGSAQRELLAHQLQVLIAVGAPEATSGVPTWQRIGAGTSVPA